jgi:hypothetical protein
VSRLDSLVTLIHFGGGYRFSSAKLIRNEPHSNRRCGEGNDDCALADPGLSYIDVLKKVTQETSLSDSEGVYSFLQLGKQISTSFVCWFLSSISVGSILLHSFRNPYVRVLSIVAGR